MGFINNLILKWYIAALKNKDPNVQAKAAEMLGNMGDAKAIEPLIAALQNYKNSFVRGQIVESLGKIGDLNKDLGVRQRVVEVLGEIGDTWAIESLIVALEDKNENVRKAVAKALSKVDVVLGQLKDRKVIVHAANYLSSQQGKQGIESLKEALDDKDLFVRLAAAGALGKIGDLRSIEILLSMFKDEKLRVEAAVALKKINHPRVIEALKEIYYGEKNYNECLRREAVFVLGMSWKIVYL